MTSDANLLHSYPMPPRSFDDIVKNDPEQLQSIQEKETVLKQIVDEKSIRKAFSSKYDKDTIAQAYAANKGIDKEAADTEIIDAVADKVREGRDLGFDDEMLKQSLVANGYDPSIQDTVMKRSALPKFTKQKLTPEEQVAEAQDLVGSYMNIHNSYSMNWAENLPWFFNDEQVAQAKGDRKALNRNIVARLKAEGFKAIQDEYGTPYIDVGEGDFREVTPSLWSSISEARGEASIGIGGTMLASAAGLMVGGPVGAVIPLIGSPLSASIGRGFDVYRNASELGEDLDNGIMAKEMMEAGFFDAVSGLVVGGTIQYGVKPLYNAMRNFVSGNEKSSLKYLKDALKLSDEDTADILTKWRSTLDNAPTRQKFMSFKGINKQVELNKVEQSVRAILETQEGAVPALKEAVGNDLRLYTVLTKDVDARAKTIRKLINDMDDPNLALSLQKDYSDYRRGVEKLYGDIKNTGANAVDGTDYSFDIQRKVIRPALDIIQQRATDPTKKQKVINLMAKIDAKTASREFTDLLEVRKELTGFLYDSSFDFGDKQMVSSLVKGLTNEADKAVKFYMGKDLGRKWSEQFASINKTYSKMLELEDDVIYKQVIGKTTATEETLRKNLLKWTSNLDINSSKLNSVLSRVPRSTRAKVEVASIKNAIDANTVGRDAVTEAVDFPALYSQLKSLNIETSEGKFLLDKVEKLTQFQSDLDIFSFSGRLRQPPDINSLTTNPTEVAKRSLFNSFKRVVFSYLPTESGRLNSLYRVAPRLFENPLDYKTIQQFKSLVPEQEQQGALKALKDFQIEFAKAGLQNKKQESFKRVYQKSSTGEPKLSNGAWGKGEYLFSKVSNKNPGDTVIGKEINLDKFATFEDMQRVLTMPVRPDNIVRMRNMKGFQERLKRAGFLGIKDGERYMLFPEKK